MENLQGQNLLQTGEPKRYQTVKPRRQNFAISRQEAKSGWETKRGEWQREPAGSIGAVRRSANNARSRSVVDGSVGTAKEGHADSQQVCYPIHTVSGGGWFLFRVSKRSSRSDRSGGLAGV
ncbi:hypothetical protein K0M31_007876 [Melipona bicolor]|uniref:Uncharacterized protein n=1 Tax=Melipona bicolor TaxID=60889 RepID=A0AA40KW56_9HYME|nr:hypothetical protein K0M31_007876 [Melipona bicolor]